MMYIGPAITIPRGNTSLAMMQTDTCKSTQSLSDWQHSVLMARGPVGNGRSDLRGLPLVGGLAILLLGIAVLLLAMIQIDQRSEMRRLELQLSIVKIQEGSLESFPERNPQSESKQLGDAAGNRQKRSTGDSIITVGLPLMERPGSNKSVRCGCNVTDDIINKVVKKCTRDKTTKSAHFTANVDKDELSRQPKNASNRLGSFDGGAFISQTNVLKFWEPSEWTDRSLYRYDKHTGKLHIRKRGIYLVYAQVLFHDSAARKSVGLYVDDDVVPMHEAISFDVIRNKRDVEFDDVSDTGPAVMEQHKHTKRSSSAMKLYSQCNFMGLVHVNGRPKPRRQTRRSQASSTEKGAMVYIKSSEKDRGILVKAHLTYWGITRLSTF